MIGVIEMMVKVMNNEWREISAYPEIRSIEVYNYDFEDSTEPAIAYYVCVKVSNGDTFDLGLFKELANAQACAERIAKVANEVSEKADRSLMG